MYEFAQKGNYDVITHRNRSILAMLGIAPDIAQVLFIKNWLILGCSDDASFVTTDAPFTLLPPTNWHQDIPRGFGISTKGTRKIFPLSQDCCLVMLDDGGGIAYKKIPKRMVRTLNTAIIQRCQRFVFGRDENLVRSVVKLSKINSFKWTPSFQMA